MMPSFSSCAAALVVAVVFAALAGPASAEPIRIVALGDSLTAGYGLEEAEGLVSVLQRVLRSRGHDVEIINAGVSGDTATSALARFDWAVPPDVDGVIVELGANDALRGIDPAETSTALEEIVRRARARKAEVLVAGMAAPRNYGHAYAEAFGSMFPRIAERYGAIIYPFFLEGVALDPQLNQPDGLHPNAKGVEVLVERFAPAVEQLIVSIKAKRP